MILVGNKCDLTNRQVGTNDGKDIAAKWGCLFIESSAFSRKNVDELFFSLVRDIRKQTEGSGNSRNNGGGLAKLKGLLKSEKCNIL